jgi:hypothetical protein
MFHRPSKDYVDRRRAAFPTRARIAAKLAATEAVKKESTEHQESTNPVAKRKRAQQDEGDELRDNATEVKSAVTADSARALADNLSSQRKKADVTKPCKYYSTGGSCSKGVKCRFVHDDAARQVAIRERAINQGHLTIAQRFARNDDDKDSMSILKVLDSLMASGRLQQDSQSGFVIESGTNTVANNDVVESGIRIKTESVTTVDDASTSKDATVKSSQDDSAQQAAATELSFHREIMPTAEYGPNGQLWLRSKGRRLGADSTETAGSPPVNSAQDSETKSDAGAVTNEESQESIGTAVSSAHHDQQTQSSKSSEDKKPAHAEKPTSSTGYRVRLVSPVPEHQPRAQKPRSQRTSHSEQPANQRGAHHFGRRGQHSSGNRHNRGGFADGHHASQPPVDRTYQPSPWSLPQPPLPPYHGYVPQHHPPASTSSQPHRVSYRQSQLPPPPTGQAHALPDRPPNPLLPPPPSGATPSLYQNLRGYGNPAKPDRSDRDRR